MVASVQPQMREAWKLLIRLAQGRLDPFVIHDLRAVDLCPEYKALGVHEKVALTTTLDHLAAVVTPIVCAYRGGLYRPGSTTPALG
jgi:hypothetical protein